MRAGTAIRSEPDAKRESRAESTESECNELKASVGRQAEAQLTWNVAASRRSELSADSEPKLRLHRLIELAEFHSKEKRSAARGQREAAERLGRMRSIELVTMPIRRIR